MKLSKFHYNFHPDLIAKFPEENRDESRMMVLNRSTGKIEHKVFKDITRYFDDKDIFVLNNTKVFPARLFGKKEKTGADIEVFLLRELKQDLKIWDVLVDPARKIRIGNKLYFGENGLLVAEVIDNTTSRGRTLRFLYDGPYEEFKATIKSLGETPLPKIIGRKTTKEDKERYQTIYAKHEGAVAAPTAGLHFSKQLMKRLELKGVDFAEVTLHVGLGNFRSVDVEDLTKHKMDAERIIITEETAAKVNKAREEKHQICAVGTTVIRTLESSVSTKGFLNACDDWTNKFIFPPHQFSVPTSMVTNFHMPFSTALMTAAAFGGFDFVMEAYHTAVKENYRFGAYGDAMLII